MPTPLTWDSPAGLTYDTPGLTWDMQVPDPPAPKPKKKKPFRRSPKPSNTPTPPPTPMSTTFKYTVAPKSTGGFTCRAVLGAEIVESEIDAAVAAATGVPVAQCPLVLQEYLRQFLACAAISCWKHEAYGMIRLRPTCGGSEALPTDFHNAADINADFSISYTKEAIEQWQSTLTIESMGEVGIITPVIDTIINETNGAIDTYVPGGPIRMRGNYMRLDQTDMTQGVFLKAGAAAEVRATFYSAMEPGQIVVTVPASLTGPLNVRIATFINGSVRSYTYTNVITQ